MNKNDELVKLLQSMIQIPSWVSDIEAEKWTVNENNLVDFIGRWLENKTNLKLELQPLEYGRLNLVAYKGDPKIIFLAHTDTVAPPVNSVYPAFGGELHDGKVWGRGSADMKSGIAALMQAAELSPKANNYAIFFYADEEYDFLGMKALVKECSHLRPKYLISADGADLKMGNGCRGLIEIRFRVIGKASHATSRKGVNAVMGVYKIMQGLEGYFEEKLHFTMGLSSLNLAYILGGKDLGNGKVKSVKLTNVGQEGNMVPDIAEAVIDIRPSSPEVTVEGIVERMNLVAKNFGATLEVINVRHNLGAWFTPREDVKEFEKIAGEVCGIKEIKFSNPQMGGYLDLQMLWQSMNKPISFVFGAGSAGTEHADNECVEIDNLIKTRDFFVEVMKKYC